jgi:hypothetical protein
MRRAPLWLRFAILGAVVVCAVATLLLLVHLAFSSPPFPGQPVLALALGTAVLLLTVALPVVQTAAARLTRRVATARLAIGLTRGAGLVLITYRLEGNVFPQLPLTDSALMLGVALSVVGAVFDRRKIFRESSTPRAAARNPQL